jgi:hypothetical protein
VLNDAQIQSHATHQKHIVERVVASPTINITYGTNYRSIKSQIGVTPREHVAQGFQVVLGKTQPIVVHLAAPFFELSTVLCSKVDL